MTEPWPISIALSCISMMGSGGRHFVFSDIAIHIAACKQVPCVRPRPSDVLFSDFLIDLPFSGPFYHKAVFSMPPSGGGGGSYVRVLGTQLY